MSTTTTTKRPPAPDSRTPSKAAQLLGDRRLPVLVTAGLFLAMYVAARAGTRTTGSAKRRSS